MQEIKFKRSMLRVNTFAGLGRTKTKKGKCSRARSPFTKRFLQLCSGRPEHAAATRYPFGLTSDEDRCF